MTDTRLGKILDLIDTANGRDPNMVNVDGRSRPAELAYGERMSAALKAFCPTAGEHLQIACRAQHLERWTSPRASYPEGRTGYLKWRTDLKQFHAARTGELMKSAGYEDEDIDRVAGLIAKRGIKRDPEAQMLEDVACLTFLEHYADDFIAPHDDEKVIDILTKTARKMSAEGLAAAARLRLPDRLARLLQLALATRRRA